MAPTWFVVSLCCLLMYLGFVVWAQTQFGSYRYALSYLRGSRLQVRPVALTLGQRRPGEILEVVVTLKNHGSKPAKVLGALADCSCVGYRGLPATLPPGQSIERPITIRFGKQAGEWHQSVTYLTDETSQPGLRVELSGLVASATP